MKKIYTLILIACALFKVNAQVYTMSYTHYAQMDTLSHSMMKDVSSHALFTLEKDGKVVLLQEENKSPKKFYVSHKFENQESTTMSCISEKDNSEWVISFVNMQNMYYCIMSSNRSLKMFKKQR